MDKRQKKEMENHIVQEDGEAPKMLERMLIINATRREYETTVNLDRTGKKT